MTHIKHYKIVICVVFAYIVLFFSAVIMDNITGKYKGIVDDEFRVKIDIVLPEKIYVVNDAVIEWINSEETAKNVFDRYRLCGRLDYTEPVYFLYTIDNFSTNYQIKNQYFTLTDKSYSKEIFSKKLSAEKRSLHIENLRPDTVYEYSIQVVFSNGNGIEKTGEFRTEESPCFLFIDGARNVRDIGTIKTSDGRQIKKYMIYRGSEIDGAVKQGAVISEEGKHYMLNDLNIKTEIDLRWYDEKTMKDVLGPNVAHDYYFMSAYNDFFESETSVRNAKKLFSVLANPESYPLYIHCSYGADRTGTIFYFIEALLGVDEQTLYQEWETSVICNGDSFYEAMDDFLIRFKKLKGNTMQEKAENYLLSIGVTKQEIESVREILLTD